MLPPNQQRFVEEYLVDLNATAAAARAGYSEHTARQQGTRLLSKASVQDAIAAAQAARAERTGVQADDVVRGLLAEARRLGKGSSHAARVAAWGWLGRHLGLFLDRHEVIGEPISIIEVVTPGQVEECRRQRQDDDDPPHHRNGRHD